VSGPPYPIARRAVVGPVYRRSFYRAPVVFAPTPVVSGGVFFGF